MASARSYSSGNFLLQLDGVKCGFLRSVEGGGATAEVVVEPGTDFFAKKRLGVVRYEPVTLALDLSLEKSVYGWIGRTWKGAYERHDLSLIAVDGNLKPVSERELLQTSVAAVTVPALDAASKEPAHLTVVVAPEYSRTRKASGAAVKLPAAKQKQWLPSNFRLSIDGLDCSRVSKIDAFTVKQAVAEDAVGEVRAYAKAAPKLDFPPLRITLAESHAQTWRDWHEDFVVRGNNSEAQEKGGSLELLAPNRQDVLARLAFFGLGIFRLAPLPSVAGSDQVARLVAELYCERMELIV